MYDYGQSTFAPYYCKDILYFELSRRKNQIAIFSYLTCIA